MTALEELEMTARNLSERLEKMSQDERIFANNVCQQLWEISYTMYKSANDLKEVIEYIA